MNVKKINILLIEDEDAHADLISLAFESTTIPIILTRVRNLDEAHSRIAESSPDLILADYILPDGKGTELIPADTEEPPYPVVIMTSHGDEKIAVQAMKAGAFDYIVKSAVELDNLPNICDKILLEWDYTVRHKRIEKELKESEARFRSILSSLYESAVIIYDREGKIKALWGTPEMDKRYGLRAVDVIGRSIVEFVLPDQAELRLAEIKRVFDVGEKILTEHIVTLPNGNFWHEISLSPMRDAKDNINAVVGFIRDITERKKSEQRLQASEERFRELAENIPEVFWIASSDFTQLQYISPAYENVWCRTCKSLYENPKSWMDSIHQDDLDKVTAALEGHIRGKTDFAEEYRIIRPDGSERWIRDRAFSVKTPTGMIDHIIGIAEDITEHKKMEATLLQSEKLNSLGTITAGVAHEFNNILAVIMGSAEVLEGCSNDDKALKNGLEAIIKASEDGAEIVKSMLTFAKSELKVSDYIFVDIQYLIKQAVEFTMPRWKNIAQSKGLTYHIDTVDVRKAEEVFCNPTELREVFINLINNALDAMPGGGTITISTRSISQADELKDDFIEITFADTGKGMSEEIRKKVFDPFFTTRRPHGTGLGMSVAYSIIKRHYGKIKVESQVGKGTTFNLSIPVRKDAVQKAAPSEPVREITTKKLRILAIDDEQQICTLLNDFFSREGHAIKTADNGAEAIELTRREDFDLVLCDLVMPDVTGYDVIRAINELDKKPKIGIATGWGEKIKMIEEEDWKVDFIIKKPFNFSTLRKKINELGI